MKLKIAVAAFAALAATPVLAQSTPAGASAPRSLPMSPMRSSLAAKTPTTLRERVAEMEGTMEKMHLLLAELRTRADASPRDTSARTNLRMWELLVSHLDNDLKEMQISMVAREDLEARRAALYRQADAKAQAEAEAARTKMITEHTSPVMQSPGAPAQPPANAAPPASPNAH